VYLKAAYFHDIYFSIELQNISIYVKLIWTSTEISEILRMLRTDTIEEKAQWYIYIH
jgi:hypothetical protein